MNAYVYHWSLKPQPDMRIEIRIEAASATAARREVVDFLEKHDGRGWRIESVSRSLAWGVPDPGPAAPTNLAG